MRSLHPVAEQPSNGGNGANSARSHGATRAAALGRTLPLDFSSANGRSQCSALIDRRRHAKVWISMSQPPLTQPRSRPREQFGPSCDTSSMSAFVIWAATPWEGRGAATAKPRIISAYSSTCSDMASASSTSMPRYLTVLSIFVCPKEWASYYASPFSLKIKGPLRTVRC